MRAALNARLSSLLSLNIPSSTVGQEEAQGEQPQEEQPEAEPEFEFRLFSNGPAQKVVLEKQDDEYAIQQGGEIQPAKRPLEFYIRGELSEEELQKLRFAAVSARDIVAVAGKRAWGLEVPWRVTRISVTTKPPSEGDERTGKAKTKAGRARPGKKMRIRMRVKSRTEKEKLVAVEKLKMSKEEHLKEKKKRLNREKKLKRRQKEKEKKMAAQANGETGGPEAPESDPESDGSE